jgi:hypothetical protein
VGLKKKKGSWGQPIKILGPLHSLYATALISRIKVTGFSVIHGKTFLLFELELLLPFTAGFLY